MCCRELTQSEINNVLGTAGLARVSACSCCGGVQGQMCSSGVRINGDYRLTLEGAVSRKMMNAIAGGEPVTVRYTGRTCMGQYTVTVTGEPENVTTYENCRMRFTMEDFVAEGFLKY
jgi:hypothetical protein